MCEPFFLPFFHEGGSLLRDTLAAWIRDEVAERDRRIVERVLVVGLLLKGEAMMWMQDE